MPAEPQGVGLARVHTNQSKRKARDGLERKVVFKSVLDNPFHVRWPNVSLNVQNAILACAVQMMQGLAGYHLARRAASRKGKGARRVARKAQAAEGRSRKKRKLNGDADDSQPPATGPDGGQEEESGATLNVPEEELPAPDVTMDEESLKPSPPPILEGLTVGINEVTKRLEAQCRGPRLVMSTSDSDLQPADTTRSRPPVRVVLVCRSDVDPPFLIAHIPQLVAACNANAKDADGFVKLVPLPKDAEFSLAETMGLRRVAVIALDSTIAHDPSLTSLLESVPSVIAPWVVSLPSPRVPSASKANPTAAPGSSKLIPTHVKQLRTTAPKDMRAAKEQRVKGRAEAKQRKKEKLRIVAADAVVK